MALVCLPCAANLARAVSTHRRWTLAASDLPALGFDANGDSLQQFVTFYRIDKSAKDGAGDWVIMKQQDFGSAP